MEAFVMFFIVGLIAHFIPTIALIVILVITAIIGTIISYSVWDDTAIITITFAIEFLITAYVLYKIGMFFSMEIHSILVCISIAYSLIFFQTIAGPIDY